MLSWQSDRTVIVPQSSQRTECRALLVTKRLWVLVMNRLLIRLLLVVAILGAGASLATAQIAGTVRDTSGGVLPGVTIEASSPALITKSRTASPMNRASIAFRSATRNVDQLHVDRLRDGRARRRGIVGRRRHDHWRGDASGRHRRIRDGDR